MTVHVCVSADEAGGWSGGWWGVGVLLGVCKSGASFLCVFKSPIVWLHEPATLKREVKTACTLLVLCYIAAQYKESTYQSRTSYFI
jgi:hypothetical protein